MGVILAQEIKTQLPTEEIYYVIKLNLTNPTITGETVEWIKVEGGDGSDVSSTVMPAGSISVSGDELTLPLMKSLTAGNLYKILVTATVNNNKRAMMGKVLCIDEEDM